MPASGSEPDVAASTASSHHSAPRLLAAAILQERRSSDGGRSRLPTERELAERHGVTRAAIREAMAILAAEGRISREVGRGTFLLSGAEPPPSNAPDGADADAGNISPADVLAARRLIEPELLRLVVVRATERDLIEIDRILAGGATVQTTEEFEHWDLAFHRAIANASHNALLIRMYGSIEDARRGEIWGNLKRRGDSPERRKARHSEHLRIAEALHSRDMTAATTAMDDHLRHVTAIMLGGVASLDLAFVGS